MDTATTERDNAFPAPVTETPGAAGMDRLTTLAARLLEHRERKDNLAAETKANNADIDAIEQAMCETMLSSELGKFTFQGRTFFMSERTRVNGKADRRDDLIAYLDENGHGDLAKRSVNAQSLGALVRELRDENGGVIPDDLADLVNIYPMPTISVRKG